MEIKQRVLIRIILVLVRCATCKCIDQETQRSKKLWGAHIVLALLLLLFLIALANYNWQHTAQYDALGKST